MRTLCASGRRLALLLAVGLTTFEVKAQSLQMVTGVDPAQGSPSGSGGDSYMPLLSPDGRYVLFASTANNLLLTTNNFAIPARFPAPLNVFLRDRLGGTTALVSVNTSGAAGGNGDSLPADLSTNGRYAVFESGASDLVAGDTNNATDIFIRDLIAGVTTLVSVSTNGFAGNGASRSAALTPDGRYVAFVSAANNLVPGDTNRIADVFVRDLQAGVTVRASVDAVSTNSALALGGSEAPDITPDGRYVAFFSTATNLVPGVPSGGDVYVRDLVGGVTIWASAGARAALQSALQATGAVSYNQVISADGQFVAYETSSRTNASAAPPAVILRYNFTTGLTDVVDTNAAVASAAYEDIHDLEMTPDGRFIAFIGKINGTTTTCVRLWDANTGVATLVSGDLSNQVTPNSTCDWPSVDPTGQFVTFLSSATNLTTNTIRGDYHLYRRDTVAGTTDLLDADTNGVGSGLSPVAISSLSQDAHLAAFEGGDGNLVANDRNHDTDLFLRDLVAGATELISARHSLLAAASANGPSTIGPGSVSTDGRWLAFSSDADNLASNDTNACRDILIRDLATGTSLLVSVATNGFSGDAISSEPAISPEGRYVAFTSSADNLVAGDTNKAQDVFVRDLQAGTTLLVSINAGGTGPGNGASYSPAINADGRFVLFRSVARNLAAGSFTSENLFLRDRQTAMTYALTTAGVLSAAMTPDGRFVAFIDIPGASAGKIYLWDSLAAARVATNAAVAGLTTLAISPDANRIAYWGGSGAFSLFVWERSAGTNGLVFNGTSIFPRAVLRFNRTGQFLAFTANKTNQVYLHDFQSGTNLVVSHGYGTVVAANGGSDSPDISADGRFVAYRSAASDLVPGGGNGVPEIFLFDRQTGSNTLLSINQSGLFPTSRSLTPVFSGDGRTLFFQSWASDLVSNDFNHSSDLVAYSFFYALVFPSTNAGQGPWLSWPYTAGKNYAVQFKTNLTDPAWQDVGGAMTNAGNRAWLQDPAPDASRRFYRIATF